MLDREIKVFYLENRLSDSGTENVVIKHYIHPRSGFLKCSFRELSSDEIVKNRQTSNEATAQFTVNPRVITNDMFVELTTDVAGLRTWQITSVDGYQDRGLSFMKVQGKLVQNPVYEEIDDSPWSIQL